jgi:hypothetical protein
MHSFEMCVIDLKYNFLQTLALWHRVQYFIATILFSAEQREKYWQYIDFSMMRWSRNFTNNTQ